MKKMIIALIILMLSGCGHLAEQSGFWKHDAIYKSWDHMWFSVNGHRHPDVQDVKKGKQQGWWGIPVEVQVKEIQ